MRKTIPFGGYLAYKFAEQDLTFGRDIIIDVMAPDALVGQAREFSARKGVQIIETERRCSATRP